MVLTRETEALRQHALGLDRDRIRPSAVTDRLSHDRPQKHPLTTSVICKDAVRAVIILKLTLHTYALKKLIKSNDGRHLRTLGVHVNCDVTLVEHIVTGSANLSSLTCVPHAPPITSQTNIW